MFNQRVTVNLRVRRIIVTQNEAFSQYLSHFTVLDRSLFLFFMFYKNGFIGLDSKKCFKIVMYKSSGLQPLLVQSLLSTSDKHPAIRRPTIKLLNSSN